ncbi:MAG: beta-lactamase family protein [Thermomicrobiales bacterium]|nr:beta-lactamase family protein [Thermomicrobiales bacterium]
MSDHTATFSRRFSRRQALALAAGAGAATFAASPRRLFAQTEPPDSSATAPAPATSSMPMPVTMAADASPTFRAVADALTEALRTFHVPGAALGLLTEEREEHATFGLESISSTRPVTEETLFGIGSLTKTFTSTAVWRLIDEGALALDAPVRDYLPDFRLPDEAAAAGVTIANLLDHTGGWWGDDFSSPSENDDALARYVADVFPTLFQIFPLGEFFSYNNAGFILLGRLIEVVTGTVYEPAMRHLLLDPLGLHDSVLERDEVLKRRFADGHVFAPINGHDSLAVQTPIFLPRSASPAGCIWSTTRDLIRYARFHMNGDEVASPARVVQSASLLRMQEPAKAIPGIASMQMGMDWFVQDIDGIRAISHGGDTGAHHAEFVAIPEHRFAFVLLANNDGGGSMAAMQALDAALAHTPGLEALAGRLGLTRALLAPPDAAPLALSPEERGDYLGRYATPDGSYTVTESDSGLELTIEDTTGQMTFQPAISAPAPPPMPLVFIEKDVATAGGSRYPFVRDAEGRVRWVSVGLRLQPRADD